MSIQAPVLFEITASDSHLAILLPVMKMLREGGTPLVLFSDCEILRTESRVSPLEEASIPFVRLAEHPLPGPDLDWELEAVPLRARIEAEVTRLHPSAVVVLNDRNFPSNTYIRRARRLGIPTLLVQESLRKDLFQEPTLRKLLFRWRRRILFGIEGGLRKYGQGKCDWYAAWGETSVEYFRKVGVPRDRIRITGNPRFDQLATARGERSNQALRAGLGFAPNGFLLTFLSSPIEKMLLVSAREKEEALSRFLKWVQALRSEPGWKELGVVFKLHRGESAERFRDFLRMSEAQGFAQVAEAELYPLVSGSDATLMFSTTAGLEAALLGTPVGILGLSKPLDDWDLVGRGVATQVTSLENLRAFLEKVNTVRDLGWKVREAARAYVAHIGEASQCVARMIEQVARGEIPQ
ncbi:MAG: hypothetical protein ABSF61_03755 [Anaerolineales bacterium]|jgi:hypothetical protein